MEVGLKEISVFNMSNHVTMVYLVIRLVQHVHTVSLITLVLKIGTKDPALHTSIIIHVQKSNNVVSQ